MSITAKVYIFVNGNHRILRQVDAGVIPGHLTATWQQRLDAKVIQSPLETIERQQFGPIEARLCPWRAGRPLPTPVTDANIKQPHQTCRFDDEGLLQREGFAAFSADDHMYYLLLNLFPVSHHHYLLVKSPVNLPEQLSQFIHSPEDILGLAQIHQILPESLSLLFNSNFGGATGSGGSINHFHVHMLEFGETGKARPLKPIAKLASKNVDVGGLQNWPFQVRVFEGTDLISLSQQAYLYSLVLTESNNAYNIVFFRYEDGRARIAIIPRSLSTPTIPFKDWQPCGPLGGDSHVGSMCSLSNITSFRAMQDDPQEAECVLVSRVKETGISAQKLKIFDQRYLHLRRK